MGIKEQEEIRQRLIDEIELDLIGPRKGKTPQERQNAFDKNIDKKSLMDYFVLETFFANNDWPANNSICYKAGDNRWKWLLNDLDYSLAYPGVSNVNINVFEKLKSGNSIYATLFNFILNNEKLLKSFKTRVDGILKEELADDRVQFIFESLKSSYQNDIENHNNRWRFIDDWEMNCQNNLDFLYNRKEIYLNQLKELK